MAKHHWKKIVSDLEAKLKEKPPPPPLTFHDEDVFERAVHLGIWMPVGSGKTFPSKLPPPNPIFLLFPKL